MPYRPLFDGSTIMGRHFAKLKDYLSKAKSGFVTNPQLCNVLATVGPHKPGSFPWMTLVLGSEALAPKLRYTAADIAAQVDINMTTLNGRDTQEYPLSEFDRRCVTDFIGSLFRRRSGKDVLLPDRSKPGCNITYSDLRIRLFHAAALLNITYFLTKAAHVAPINRWDDEPLVLKIPGRDPGPYLRKRWEVTERAVEALAAALEADPGDDYIQKDVLGKLVNNIQTRLATKADISSEDLLAITEVSWYYLLKPLVLGDDKKQYAYLAWPDMLLPLGFQGASPRSRPSLTNPVSARRLLAEALQEPTDHRLKAYSSASHGGQDTADSHEELLEDKEQMSLYKVYADILAAEAKIHKNSVNRKPQDSAKKSVDRTPQPSRKKRLEVAERLSEKVENVDERSPETPYPTAFVTTFDLELELALRHHHPDVPIIVAVPMTFSDAEQKDVDTRSTSVWMGYLIDATDDSQTAAPLDGDLLAPIQHPPASKWFLFVEEGTAWHTTNEEVNKCIDSAVVIVRLTGSPLVSFPTVDPIKKGRKKDDKDPWATERTALGKLEKKINELRKANAHVGDVSDTRYDGGDDDYHVDMGKVVPATILEEHHALQLSFPDIVRLKGGLPVAFTSWTPTGYWRYWALLGVQASNEAIRYRLIAQLIGPGLTKSGEAQPKRSGVALNASKLSSRASDLLEWSEFELVTETKGIGLFKEYLEDYLRHIKAIDTAQTIDMTHWQNANPCEFLREVAR